MIKDDIFLDNEIDESLKELAVSAGYNIRADLLISDIALDLPESRWKNNKDLSLPIMQYVNSNRSSKEEEVRNNFKKLLIWMRDYEERAKEIFFHRKIPPCIITRRYYQNKKGVSGQRGACGRASF